MIFNIIDNRKRNYLWKRVNAIVEPTWHDNTHEEADKAEPSEGEVDYDERERISVADAVAWAGSFPYPVTLHLYDESDER